MIQSEKKGISLLFIFIIFLFFADKIQAKPYSLYDKSIETLKKEAVGGNKRSQYNLGLAYLDGDQVKASAKKAIFWLKKSARQNYVKAIHKLGLIYFENKYGGSNYKQGYKWMVRAAKANNGISQHYLALMYLQGKGVKKDVERAYYWATQAKKNKVIGADELIATIEHKIKTTSTMYTEHHSSTMSSVDPTKVVQARPRSRAQIKTNRIIKQILKTNWMKNSKPAETLPSAISQCKSDAMSLQCFSKRLKNNNKHYLLHYKVESLITDFAKNNKFYIRYRYSYLFVMPHDADDPNPSFVMPKMGSKTALLNLRCQYHSVRLITCVNETGQKIRYTK